MLDSLPKTLSAFCFLDDHVRAKTGQSKEKKSTRPIVDQIIWRNPHTDRKTCYDAPSHACNRRQIITDLSGQKKKRWEKKRKTINSSVLPPPARAQLRRLLSPDECTCACPASAIRRPPGVLAVKDGQRADLSYYLQPARPRVKHLRSPSQPTLAQIKRAPGYRKPEAAHQASDLCFVIPWSDD